MNEAKEDRLIREALREAGKGPVARVIDQLRILLTPRVAFAISLTILLGWLFRWETLPGPELSFYMLNRWTGNVYLVIQDQRLEVKEPPIVFGGGDKPAK